MNLKSMLEKTAKQYARNTAIVQGERRISYAELDEAANKVASSLIKMGVNKGDRVAMLISNRPEFVEVYFGIIKAGGIAVPLDVRYRVDELASLFDNCLPKVIIAESSALEPLMPALPRFKSIEHIVDLDARCQGAFMSYQDILSGSARHVEVTAEPWDIGTISYTGGPALHPHGATLSHRNLVAEAMMAGDAFQQTDNDRAILFALPMYHMFGMASVLLASVYKGSTVVIVPGTGRSISTLLETIEKEKGTIYMGVPYIYALAVYIAQQEGIKNDLSSLRLWCSGGAPITIDLIQQFKKHYGFELYDIWGLTEAVSNVTYHPPHGKRKLGSCGKAMPGWEIKIVDDNDNKLPANQTGEIAVEGPIMDGYYNNPELTAETVRNGWLYTGDLGKLDEDGYLYITGRKKRMLILKGQNVYPSDIEQVLRTHPKVSEVRVTGTPDELRGEVVQATIRLKTGVTATEQEIRRFCQERMADYKSPKQIIFTDGLMPADTDT